jgi:hypothetical protein
MTRLAVLPLFIIILCATVLSPGLADPIWPSMDSLWNPLYVGSSYLPDPDNDFTGANGLAELDIEGNATYPAGYYYLSDQGTPSPSDDVLMFRMRIDGTKVPLSSLSATYQFSFDTDSNASTVDWVLQFDMVVDNDVELVPTIVGGPTYGDVSLSTTNTWAGAAATWGRLLIPAGDGSTFGGNSDYFVDVSIPWSTWAANTGLTLSSPFRVALSTSTNHNVIVKDFPQAFTSSGSVSGGFSDPVEAVPEPGTLALMGLSLGAILIKRRRQQKQTA